MIKPRKRLVKAKIKEDRLVTYTAKAQTYYDQNRRTIFLGILGAVVILAIVVGVVLTKSSAEKQSAYESLLVRDAFSRGDLDKALIHINIIMEDYPGTRSAAIAMMIKGRVHEQRGELNEAVETFKKLTDKYADQDYLAFGAYYSLGSILYSWAEYSEAGRYYATGASRYPNNFNAPYSLLEAGRCFKKSGKYKQANQAFRQVLSEYPKSRAVRNARSELEEIEFMR